jgi:hypothetical protein
MFEYSAAVIAAFVGTLLTIFFAYFPRVRVWYAALAIETASLYKLGLMVVIAGVLFGLSFIQPGMSGVFPAPLTPLQLGAVVVALIITNQPVASVLPAPADVRNAIKVRTSKFLRGY